MNRGAATGNSGLYRSAKEGLTGGRSPGTAGTALGADQTSPDGVADQSGGAMDLQFLRDALAVGLGGLGGDAELGGGLLRRQTLGDQTQKLQLPGRQRVVRGRSVATRSVPARPRIRWAHVHGPPGNVAHRLD